MLEAIAARLGSVASPPLRLIAGAEDIAALAEGTAPADMSAYVLPFAQQAAPNERQTGPILQRVTVQFLVAVCIRKHGDAKGGSRIGVTSTIDDALEAALLGWSPRLGADPIELISSRTQPAKNGVLWHVSTWSTGRYAQEV